MLRYRSLRSIFPLVPFGSRGDVFAVVLSLLLERQKEHFHVVPPLFCQGLLLVKDRSKVFGLPANNQPFLDHLEHFAYSMRAYCMWQSTSKGPVSSSLTS